MKIGACGGCGAPTQRCVPCPHCGEVTLCARPSGAAIILGLSLMAGCTDDSPFCEPPPGDQAEYGTSAIEDDVDRDGWPVPDDCDDADPEAHPGATETPGDGVDSNCGCGDDE